MNNTRRRANTTIENTPGPTVLNSSNVTSAQFPDHLSGDSDDQTASRQNFSVGVDIHESFGVNICPATAFNLIGPIVP